MRLDHAPSDFDKLEASAKYGATMQKTASSHEAAIAPVTPVLETVAHNRRIYLLGKLPFVGKHFEMAESGLETASELGNSFVHLVDLDREHIQPLRAAILTSARLRRSRRREDLPATVEALDGAIKPLNGYEDFGEKQDRKLTSYIKFLGTIDERNFAHRPEKEKDSETVEKAIAKMRKINASLEILTTQLHDVRVYAEACASDGHAAMRTSQTGETHARQDDATH